MTAQQNIIQITPRENSRQRLKTLIQDIFEDTSPTSHTTIPQIPTDLQEMMRGVVLTSKIAISLQKESLTASEFIASLTSRNSNQLSTLQVISGILHTYEGSLADEI